MIEKNWKNFIKRNLGGNVGKSDHENKQKITFQILFYHQLQPNPPTIYLRNHSIKLFFKYNFYQNRGNKCRLDKNKSEGQQYRIFRLS